MRHQQCPICHVTYSNLPKHLSGFHNVANPKEKALLLSLSSGRVKGLFRCEEPQCRKTVKRLDRHYAECHFDKTPDEAKSIITRCKKQYILEQLGKLRATHPQVLMVSVLDLGGRQTTQDDRWTQPPPDAPAAADPACSQGPRRTSSPKSEVLGRSIDIPPDTETPEMSTDVKPEPAPAETTQDLTPNCSNTDCQQLLRENQELKARLGLGKGECPRQDCQHKSQELSRLAQLYMASPQKKLRNKFSRKDDFETEHAPKYEQVLQDFFVFVVGANPSSKVKDNCKTCRSHVRRFLLFAGEGKLLKGDFSFLANSTKIAEWVEVLKTDRMKPTTIRINLVNIHKFFKFLNNLPATQTKLSVRDFQRIHAQIKARLKDLQKDVTVHSGGRQLRQRTQTH
ncbi:uncharacterized protein LOC125801238 [Astyanax mexicanus]|uniref:uncharacterized protein LOC125801238 n=1 Tax=Astyanax mexicanus TaxID=7994 RepID=UPI0020CB5C9A|nr:uncharacterized protein LOC125801238 [Astyanax mexicanus]XP_049333609.1 uncharacterized protein LOC125801238 [Astyanax mexicanus]